MATQLEEVHFKAKLTLIKSRLHDIKKRQREHQRQSMRMERLHQCSKAAVHALNAVSITSLLVNMVGHDLSLVVCAITGGLSTVGSAILEVVDLYGRQIRHQDSHLQLLDLYNDVTASILHESTTSVTLDMILSDLNHRSALLYGNAPLVRTASSITYNGSSTASYIYRDRCAIDTHTLRKHSHLLQNVANAADLASIVPHTGWKKEPEDKNEGVAPDLEATQDSKGQTPLDFSSLF